MQKEKPSRTALKVALNILTLGSKEGMEKVLPDGIVDTTERLLIASSATSERIVRWHRTSKMVSIYEAFDWLLPGQFEAFAYRKSFCEQHVRDGITAGAVQILVLGAGYDTLAYRLAPHFPEVHFFEIDHPATARLKAKGIQEMGLQDNHHLISEDLGKRKLIDVLKSNTSWDDQASTVFIAEGLLMYLALSAVQDLFKQCASVSGDNSRIAFTYIGKDPDGRPDAGPCTDFMLWALKVHGEPWLWCIQPDQIGGMLEDNGWTYLSELGGETKKQGIEYFGLARK